MQAHHLGAELQSFESLVATPLTNMKAHFPHQCLRVIFLDLLEVPQRLLSQLVLLLAEVPVKVAGKHTDVKCGKGKLPFDWCREIGRLFCSIVFGFHLYSQNALYIMKEHSIYTLRSGFNSTIHKL